MTAFAVAVLVIVALAIPAVRHLRETPPPSPPETRVEIVTPATDQPTDRLRSRPTAGRSSSWPRVTARPVCGCGRWRRRRRSRWRAPRARRYPFWSPDGRSVGFFAGSALKRLDLGGGAPQTLAPVTNGRGGTWNADGVIVFAPSRDEPPDARVRHRGRGGRGDDARPAAVGHRCAVTFCPTAAGSCSTCDGAPDTAGIYLGALDGERPDPADARRQRRGVSARLGRPRGGWLLWVRAGTLVAQRLDVAKAALTGEPVTLADGVAADDRIGAPSRWRHGLVAYRTGAGSQRQLTWVDRSGTARGTVGDPDGTLSRSPRIPRRPSRGRDPHGAGQHGPLAAGRRPHEPVHVRCGCRPLSRLVARRHPDRVPLEPDGSGDLYQKLTSGAGVEERLVASDQVKSPQQLVGGRPLPAVSQHRPADERRPLGRADGGRSHAVGVPEDPLPRGAMARSRRTAGGWPTSRTNRGGRRSTCGRLSRPARRARRRRGWGQWQVSTAGGIYPVWRPDGKELYYLNPAGAMMAAPITVTGATLAPGAPVVLFPTRIFGGGVDAATGPAVRRRPRRALPHQHGTGQRRRADHAAAELESRGEEVALAQRITRRVVFSNPHGCTHPMGSDWGFVAGS